MRRLSRLTLDLKRKRKQNNLLLRHGSGGSNKRLTNFTSRDATFAFSVVLFLVFGCLYLSNWSDPYIDASSSSTELAALYSVVNSSSLVEREKETYIRRPNRDNATTTSVSEQNLDANNAAIVSENSGTQQSAKEDDGPTETLTVEELVSINKAGVLSTESAADNSAAPNMKKVHGPKEPLAAATTTKSTRAIYNALPWYRPLDCKDFLKQVQDGVLQVPPVTPLINHTYAVGGLYPFNWSIHPDMMLDEDVLKRKYTRSLLNEMMLGVIRNSPAGEKNSNNVDKDTANTIVIEVGSMTGYYASYAAIQGQQVFAFESNYAHLSRLCETSLTNGWAGARSDNDRVFSNSLSIIPAKVSSKDEEYDYGEMANIAGTSESNATIALDIFAVKRQWFKNRPHISILKIKPTTSEGKGLLGAQRLIKSNLVHNIFVEMPIDESSQAAMTLLKKAGYNLHRIGGYMGYLNSYRDSPWRNDDKLVQRLINSSPKRQHANRLAKMWWTLADIP